MFDIFKWIVGCIDRSKNNQSSECDHFYGTIGEINVPLTGGRHTCFVLLRCEKCLDKSGFPSDNLRIAIEKGTEETKKQLKELGLIKA